MGDNYADNIIKRLEKYSEDLEKVLEERNRDLKETQKTSQELLYKILPRPIAENLVAGISVIPEYFDSVTIFFNDIVKFTELCSKLSPMEIINFLNELYTNLDKIIDSMDVYKIETIGDAYMIASGVPVRNKDKHALEICEMSFKFLNYINEYRFRPVDTNREYQIQIRIGIHTGPCAAGVVGNKMPRYCLFGDTLRFAAKMESTGKAMAIQISETTKNLLQPYEENYDFDEDTLWNKQEENGIKSYFLTRKQENNEHQ